MATVTKDLGIATAYGYAKSKGYTGTEDEFAQAMLDMTTAVDDAQQYAQDAEDAKDDAQASAESIEQSAAQIATNTSDITDLKEDLNHVGMNDSVKIALLDCFEHVAWIDGNGQTYYNTLEAALRENEYPKIKAVFNSGSNTIYTDDTLDSLKQYLTVTYYETSSSSGEVISANNYVLSGTLREGESTIRVTYGDIATTFILTAVDFYNIWEWSIVDGDVQKLTGSCDPNQSDTTQYPSRTYYRSSVTARRTYVVRRGKRPYNEYGSTAVDTQYYPIPVPVNANHVKITMTPGQFIYAHFIPYNETNNYYENSEAATRISWTNLSGGSIEHDFAKVAEGKQYFLMMNSKYDSAGSSYPVEPTNIVLQFSEV